jgi:hypothetical protein
MIFGFNVIFKTPAPQGSGEALSGSCFQNSGNSINSEALFGGCTHYRVIRNLKCSRLIMLQLKTQVGGFDLYRGLG